MPRAVFFGSRALQNYAVFWTEVLNWRPQNESENNNSPNICISTI